MDKISLRVYEKEIEDLIDKGQTDEAISHCAHILSQIPKHVDTYRLMGKAYLESQRFSEASDVFQRILSVIPDDFVSNLGMSIIKEDENNLDAAIWHMERAFEFQPSNPSIQNELQRLRIRRDGIEPPRVRLTRGALVRMYERGHLYPQAIAEIKAALVEDPKRNDLLIILARLYQLAGQKSEALETCTHLISELPYCFEANRILTEILLSMGQADDAAPYRQRLIDLDPYYAHITDTIPSANLVPDNAVLIERYDRQASQSEPNQVQWPQAINFILNEDEGLPASGNSLNIEYPEEAESENNIIETVIHDEIEQIGESEVMPENVISLIEEKDLVETESEKEEFLPEWMKDAGWNIENDSSSSQAPVEISDVLVENHTEDSEIIQPAEIPQWIQALAPDNTQTQLTDEDKLPDDSSPTDLEEINPDSASPSSLSVDQSLENLGLQSETYDVNYDVLPNQSEINIAEPVMEEKMDNFSPQDPSLGDEDLPEWLKEFASSEKAKDDQVTPSFTEKKEDMSNSSDLEDAMAWLDSLAAGQDSAVETPISKSEATPPLTEDISPSQPSLNENAGEESSAGVTPEIGDFEKILSEFPQNLDETPIFEKENVPSPEPQNLDMETEAEIASELSKTELSSLLGINIPDIEKEEHLLEEEVTEPEIDFSDTSEYPWLDSLTRISKEDAIPESDILGKQDEIPPSWVIEFSKKDNNEKELTAPEMDLEADILKLEPDLSDDELPSWLKEINSVQETSTEQTSTNLPDWLKQLDTEEMGFVEEQVEQQSTSESEWTKEELPVSDLLDQPESVLSDSDLPDWLKGLEQQTPISIEELASESTTFASIFSQAPVSETEELIQEAEEPLENIESIETPASVETVEPALSNNIDISALQPEELITAEEPFVSALDELDRIDTAKEEIPGLPAVEPVEAAVSVISGSLENARIFLEQGKIDNALVEYGLLIVDGKSLDEILFDIEKALYRHPVDINLWQTYGDALAKSNRLQDALDAYTKAEELLK